MKPSSYRFLKVVIFFGILSIWEILGSEDIVDSAFISYPSEIVRKGIYMVSTGFLPHFFASLKIYLLGLTMAVMVGFLVGSMIGFNKKLFYLVRPYIYVLNSIPTVALIPLFLIWFGFGDFSKFFIVFIMSVVPILINTMDGVKNTDKDYLEMAKSVGASDFLIFKKIALYSALPFTFSGIRIGVGKGLVGLVIADLFGYGKGLGYLINTYGLSYQTGNLLFVVSVLVVISLTILYIVSKAERRIIYWRKHLE